MSDSFQNEEWKVWRRVNRIWREREAHTGVVAVCYVDGRYCVRLGAREMNSLPSEATVLDYVNHLAATQLGGWADEKRNVQDHDPVNHPVHYAALGEIECIDVLEQLHNNGEDFRILNAIKYLWRWRYKGGIESLKKAVWYIERVIKQGGDNA